MSFTPCATRLRRACRCLGLWMPLALAAGPATAPALDPAELPGHWQGDLRFLNLKVQARHGSLPVSLDIQPDLTLTGTVGEARIGPSKPRVQARQIDYRVVLDREPLPTARFSKTQVILLVTRAAGGSMDVDVHFKGAFGFDPTMWVAHLPAKRVGPQRNVGAP